MTEANLVKLLRMLNYEDHELRGNNGWINVCCPLASYKHSSGRDSHPSAGFSINATGESYFKCFTCTPNPIPLRDFVIYSALQNKYKERDVVKFFQAWELHHISHDEIDPNFVIEENELKFKYNKWINKKTKKDKLPSTPDSFPDNLLNLFPLLAESREKEAMLMKDYLLNYRRLSMSTIIELGIRYAKNRNLILFPLTDFKGNVQVIRARVCDPNVKIMFSISAKHFNSKQIFPTIKDTGASFGLHLLDPFQPTIVVESETDCMLLKTMGYPNVIATTTASFSKTQIHSIPSTDIWAAFDNDDAGRTATTRLINMSPGKLVHIVNWAHAGGKDPGDAYNKNDIDRAIKKRILAEKKVLTFYSEYGNKPYNKNSFRKAV